MYTRQLQGPVEAALRLQPQDAQLLQLLPVQL
jgi:hypothetical protein